MRIRELALLLVSACSSDIHVAVPEATGYGDVPEATSSVTSDASVMESHDAASPPVDASIVPVGDDRDAATPPAPTDAAVVDASVPAPTYATTREAFPNDLLNVTHPQDLTKVAGPMPVVVWANDGCSRDDREAYPLFDRWASAGFVVVSPYASADQGLLGIIGSLTTTDATGHASIIDWVVAQNGTGSFAGKLDLKRLVIAGDGCGGVSALSVASTDVRPAAVFVLSGSSALGGVTASAIHAIKVPVGMIVGGPDDTAGANAKQDYDAMASGVPAILVSRDEGNHQAVSSDSGILAEEADIALDWMRLVLDHDKQAYLSLTAPSVCSKCTPGDWTLYSKHLETLQP